MYLLGQGETDFLLIKIVYLFIYVENSGFITCTERNTWKPELIGTILPIYSSDVLASFVAWSPGQLPSWLAP
jgi:hypothetical protein